MTSTFVQVELVHVTVGCCGAEIGLSRDLYDKCQETGRTFYCPNCGKPRVFRTPEIQKLRSQVKQLTSNLDNETNRRCTAERQRNSVRKSHMRMRERVKNGTCPCCDQTFENLLVHMRTAHPDYGDNKTLKQLRDVFGMTQSDLASELGISQAQVSAFENERSVIQWAEDQIIAWIDAQGIVD